jgi:ankyrin repeat protein
MATLTRVREYCGYLDVTTLLLTPFMRAVRVALLEGVDVNAADDKRRTALHFAATKGSIPVLRLLLSSGANVDSRDALGNTALSVAGVFFSTWPIR